MVIKIGTIVSSSIVSKRETLELMLQRIEIYTVKGPTNMVPFPIEPHGQLGITLY